MNVDEKTWEFIILYLISFVTLIYVAYSIGTIKAQLDIILKILKKEDDNT